MVPEPSRGVEPCIDSAHAACFVRPRERSRSLPSEALQRPLLLGVLGYLAAQLLVGLLVSRKVKSERDYLLAGRSFGTVISSFTIFATWFGAETCMGAAGLAYTGGLASTGSEPFGYALCLVLMACVLAVPLWRRGLTTLADLFRMRFGPTVERAAILLMVPTSILWAAAQIRAFGLVLATLGGISVSLSITFAAVVVLLYTASGGLWADAVTDVLQGAVLIAGLITLCVIVLVIEAPGAWAALPPERLSFAGSTRTPLELAEMFAVPALGALMAQELVQRVTAARSAEVARKATLVAAVGYLLVGLMPVALGLVAHDLLPPQEHPEQVLLSLSSRYLSFWPQLLLAGALISAMLSTVDSALLVSGSLLAHNLVFAGRTVEESAKLRGNRIAVLLSGLVAYGIGLVGEGVHALVQEASSFGSSGVLVIALFGLFTTFGGHASALAALGTGVVSYVLGAHWLDLRTPFLVSLALALAAYIAVAALRGERTYGRAPSG